MSAPPRATSCLPHLLLPLTPSAASSSQYSLSSFIYIFLQYYTDISSAVQMNYRSQPSSHGSAPWRRLARVLYHCPESSRHTHTSHEEQQSQRLNFHEHVGLFGLGATRLITSCHLNGKKLDTMQTSLPVRMRSLYLGTFIPQPEAFLSDSFLTERHQCCPPGGW